MSTRSKTWRQLLVCVLLYPCAAVGQAAPETLATPTTAGPDTAISLCLDELLLLAETHNSDLAAARQRARAAAAGIVLARQLPDAMLGYTAMLEGLRSPERGLGHILMLEQRLPNPGKLLARSAAARSTERSRRAAIEIGRRALHEDITLAYAQLQELDARIAIKSRMVTLLREIEQIVEARIAADLASQSALLRLGVEIEQLDSQARILEQRRPMILASLHALVGVAPPSGARAMPQAQHFPKLTHDHATLRKRLRTHPMITMQQALVAAATSQEADASWARVPDLALAVEYMQLANSHAGLGVRAGISIPWQLRVNAARLEAARAERLARGEEFEQLELRLEARLEASSYAYRDALRAIVLYQDEILPRLRATLELISAEYAADKASLTDLLDVERSLLAAELGLISARSSARKAQAQLYSLIGTFAKD